LRRENHWLSMQSDKRRRQCLVQLNLIALSVLTDTK
jgi:hypothetical protein